MTKWNHNCSLPILVILHYFGDYSNWSYVKQGPAVVIYKYIMNLGMHMQTIPKLMTGLLFDHNNK